MALNFCNIFKFSIIPIMKAVFYATNNNPIYFLYAKFSVKSLRQFNKKIKIFLFLYGCPDYWDLSFFQTHNVCIIQKALDKKKHKHALRFHAFKELSKIPELQRLLLLDVDTICFKDIEILFERYKDFDFYAREEIACARNEKSQIRFEELDRIAHTLNVKVLPVFNLGVSIFNNASFRKIENFLNFYDRLHNRFKAKTLPYPSENEQLVDEIVASLVFGGIQDFTYGIMDNHITPWLEEIQNTEYRDASIHDPGVIVHLWNCDSGKILRKIFDRNKECLRNVEQLYADFLGEIRQSMFFNK